jgi:hypothetical protein
MGKGKGKGMKLASASLGASVDGDIDTHHSSKQQTGANLVEGDRLIIDFKVKFSCPL